MNPAMRFHCTVLDCKNKLDVLLELTKEELRNWQVIHWMLKQQNPKSSSTHLKLHELLQGPTENGKGSIENRLPSPHC